MVITTERHHRCFQWKCMMIFHFEVHKSTAWKRWTIHCNPPDPHLYIPRLIRSVCHFQCPSVPHLLCNPRIKPQSSTVPDPAPSLKTWNLILWFVMGFFPHDSRYFRSKYGSIMVHPSWIWSKTYTVNQNLTHSMMPHLGPKNKAQIWGYNESILIHHSNPWKSWNPEFEAIINAAAGKFIELNGTFSRPPLITRGYSATIPLIFQ